MSKTEQNLHKGDSINLTIESLAPGGEGVAKHDGLPVFIERVAPGDVVRAQLFDVRKNFARAKVQEILQPSPQRAEPPCPLFKVCGGCQWQHLSYENQLLAKHDIVRQAIKHIGRMDQIEIKETIASALILNYRNKAQFPVKHPNNSKRILAGYYKQDSHDLVNIKHCPVQPAKLDLLLESVKEVWERHGLSAYDERKHDGLLRHINFRFSFAHEKALLTLVLNYKASDSEQFEAAPFSQAVKAAADELVNDMPDLVGVCLNFNCARGNKILGPVTIPLAGESRIEEVLATTREDLPAPLRSGLRFSLSPTSFFQVNTKQTVQMLELIYDLVAQIGPKPLVIDAYSGVGAIALWLSGIAEKVICIEEHEAAVADGRLNAQLNGVSNLDFQLGRVEDVLPELHDQRPDLIVIDPPRKGASEEALAAIVRARPQRIVYISCNPATLARDLRLLEEMRLPGGENNDLIGYKTKQIQPVDLFPQTFHVESITVLERFGCNGAVGDLETTRELERSDPA